MGRQQQQEILDSMEYLEVTVSIAGRTEMVVDSVEHRGVIDCVNGYNDNDVTS